MHYLIEPIEEHFNNTVLLEENFKIIENNISMII